MMNDGKIEIIIKGDKRKSYHVKSPMGGYMRLTADEALKAVASGTAVIYDPEAHAAEYEAMKKRLLDAAEGVEGQ